MQHLPQALLHLDKPLLNFDNTRITIDRPAKPRKQEFKRFSGRMTRTEITTPSNMIPMAKFGASRPDALSGFARPPTQRRRCPRGTKTNSTRLRGGERPGASEVIVNLLAIGNTIQNVTITTVSRAWRRRHQTRHPIRTTWLGQEASRTERRSSTRSTTSKRQCHGARSRQPWSIIHRFRAQEGDPWPVVQTRGRWVETLHKHEINWVAKRMSRWKPPPKTAARSQGEADRHLRDATWTCCCMNLLPRRSLESWVSIQEWSCLCQSCRKSSCSSTDIFHKCRRHEHHRSSTWRPAFRSCFDGDFR